jgi:hypothetical protein
VLVLATLGAPERRRLIAARRRPHPAEPQPEPTPVTTGRATVIDVGVPMMSAAEASGWLGSAGEEYLVPALRTLNRALDGFRLVTADPYVNPVATSNALVARIGFGAGEQVADGLWSDARELRLRQPRQRRVKVLQPQARLAALLNGRERVLVCEELLLRARLDLDSGRTREAALQLLVALDAALAELPADPAAEALGDRLVELRGHREPVAGAAQSALAGPLGETELHAVEAALSRVEAALRARAVANA